MDFRFSALARLLEKLSIADSIVHSVMSLPFFGIAFNPCFLPRRESFLASFCFGMAAMMVSNPMKAKM